MSAIDPDRQVAAARNMNDLPPIADPTDEQIERARNALMREAVRPLAANPDLRSHLIAMRQRFEQTIDTISVDEVLTSEFSQEAHDKAEQLVRSFESYIAEHKNEITALQFLYERPYSQRLRFQDIKALAEGIAAPPRSWTPERLWQAYEKLDKSEGAWISGNHADGHRVPCSVCDPRGR